MSIGTGPKSSSKKSAKNITTAKEVKETKSVPIQPFIFNPVSSAGVFSSMFHVI